MEPTNAGEKSAKNVEEGEDSIPEDRSRSSSVSSASAASATTDFSFEDSYQIGEDKHGIFPPDHELSEQGLLQPGTLASDAGNAPGVSLSSSLESPPVQVMERPPDASGYRIPPYVFARNKSNTLNPEWSTASNESLFSIHTGNMSFTRDQFSWLLKSGELGMYGPGDTRKSGELGYYGELGKICDLRKSGELPPPSPKIVQKPEGQKKSVDIHKSGEQMPATPTDIHKCGEQIIAAHFKNGASKVADVGITTPRVSDAAPDLAVGTEKDDPKPGMKDKKRMKPSIDDIPLSASVSHHSDASGQSFAFPVLGEIDREKSVNSGTSRVEQAKDEGGQPKTPKSAPEGAPAPASSSWFSCFSCCCCC